MKVIRAEAMGFCFGVRDALKVTEKIADPSQVTIHGELVHNERILVQLQARGYAMTAENDRHPLPTTPSVMITAHGISDFERRRLLAADKRLIDTTCPLVTRAHRAAQMFDEEGRFVIVIGKPGHVEVRGIVEDLRHSAVVDCVEAVQTYPSKRLGVVCQTTTPPLLAEEICNALRRCNPAADLRFVDTICQPTRDRLSAVERLLPLVDGVVVVGGRNSNNTRQLVGLCEEAGKRAWHVQSAKDLDSEWFHDCRVVGLTAGTSTPDEVIADVYQTLRQLEAGVAR